MGLLHFAAVQKHDGSVSAPPFFLSKSNPLRRDLILYPGNKGHAPVAQQAEHLPFKQGVRGSNPRWSTRKQDRRRRSCFFAFSMGFEPTDTKSRSDFFNPGAAKPPEAGASGVPCGRSSKRRRPGTPPCGGCEANSPKNNGNSMRPARADDIRPYSPLSLASLDSSPKGGAGRSATPHS